MNKSLKTSAKKFSKTSFWCGSGTFENSTSTPHHCCKGSALCFDPTEEREMNPAHNERLRWREWKGERKNYVEDGIDVLAGWEIVHSRCGESAEHVVNGGRYARHLGLGDEAVPVQVVQAEDPAQLLLHRAARRLAQAVEEILRRNRWTTDPTLAWFVLFLTLLNLSRGFLTICDLVSNFTLDPMFVRTVS